MNLKNTLKDYLTMRRDLGFKLISDGRALKTFVSFLDQHQQDIITTKFALLWAKLPTIVQPARWAVRLNFVRVFARYCRVIDPKTKFHLPISYHYVIGVLPHICLWISILDNCYRLLNNSR